MADASKGNARPNDKPTHTDSRGGSKTTHHGAGTAGAHPSQTRGKPNTPAPK